MGNQADLSQVVSQVEHAICELCWDLMCREQGELTFALQGEQQSTLLRLFHVTCFGTNVALCFTLQRDATGSY